MLPRCSGGSQSDPRLSFPWATTPKPTRSHDKFRQDVAARRPPLCGSNGSQSGGSFYTWVRYFAGEGDPMHSFSLWPIHERSDRQRQFGLDCATTWVLVHRARHLIQAGATALPKVGYDRWTGTRTWLNLFLARPLAILGLGLGPQEVFLRWLLLERRRLWRRYQRRRPMPRAWFVSTSAELQAQRNRTLFLEACGVKVVGVRGYSDIWQPLLD